MLWLQFHQAKAGAGTNEIPELIPTLGGQHNFRWTLAPLATTILLFLSISTSPDEILSDPGESSLGF